MSGRFGITKFSIRRYTWFSLDQVYKSNRYVQRNISSRLSKPMVLHHCFASYNLLTSLSSYPPRHVSATYLSTPRTNLPSSNLVSFSPLSISSHSRITKRSNVMPSLRCVTWPLVRRRISWLLSKPALYKASRSWCLRSQ